MNDFFKRKEEVKVELPTHGDYDVKNFDNDMASCGVTDVEGLIARYNQLFGNLVVDSDQENPVATVCKRIEETFSHREISFLMARDLLQAAYNESVQNLKKENKNGK